MSRRRELAELHDDLRRVARDLLGAEPAQEPAWSQVAAAGWLSLEAPEALDGAGATFAELAVVAEEVGRAAAAGPFLGTAVLGVGALLAVEPSGDRDDLLRAIGAGAARVAVAVAPTGDEPVPSPPFTVVGAGERATLHGTARFVVDAPDADDLLLLAAGPAGDPVVVHVAPGAVAVTPEPLVDATRRVGTVAADGVALAPEAVWSFARDPAAGAQHLVDRAAVALAADALGLGAAMLDVTVAYVSDRHQFGRPVGSFQAVKHACADMLVAQSVGRELLDAAVEATATGTPDAGAAAARAKSSVGAATVDVVGAALQLHGGMGYTWESGIHVYLKRAVLDRSLFGSPVAHRRRLAAMVLDGSTRRGPGSSAADRRGRRPA